MNYWNKLRGIYLAQFRAGQRVKFGDYEGKITVIDNSDSHPIEVEFEIERGSTAVCYFDFQGNPKHYDEDGHKLKGANS